MILQCPNCTKKNRVNPADAARTVRCGQCRSALTPISGPIDADPELFDEVVQHATLPVLVDFWASWCGPCRTAAPEVARAASVTAGRALVLKVNTERHPEIAARYRVEGIPNFVVIKRGQLIHQHAGVVSSGQLVRWLEASSV